MLLFGKWLLGQRKINCIQCQTWETSIKHLSNYSPINKISGVSYRDKNLIDQGDSRKAISDLLSFSFLDLDG